MNSTMDQKQLLDFFDKVTKNMRDIMVRKNSDYTGGNKDPFGNFSAVEHIDFGVSTEQGILVRMTDKIKRIASFVKQGTLQVKDESVSDTLLDLANYCILFAAFLSAKKVDKSAVRSTFDNCIATETRKHAWNHKGTKCMGCGFEPTDDEMFPQ